MSRPTASPRKAAPVPIVAGSLLVGCLLLGAGIGFGLGTLVGAGVIAGLAGLFVGLVVGFLVVHDRYRDL